MKKTLLFILLASFLIVGCTEEESKEFTNAIIKDAIKDSVKSPLDAIKNIGKHPTPTPRLYGFDDRLACSEEGKVEYSCKSGYLYRAVCDGIWAFPENIGTQLETCDGYYQKISCNGNNLVDTGFLEEISYCLASGSQLGRTFCRGGEVKHEITNCESQGQVCKEAEPNIRYCMAAPPKGYCDYNYITGECPISCIPTGNSEPGLQCRQVK